MSRVGTTGVTRILWVSRHPAEDLALHELREIVGGEIDLVHIQGRIRFGDEVTRAALRNDCRVIVIVLPIDLQEQVLENKNGETVLRPVYRHRDEQGRTMAEPVFLGFEELVEVKVVTKRRGKWAEG